MSNAVAALEPPTTPVAAPASQDVERPVLMGPYDPHDPDWEPTPLGDRLLTPEEFERLPDAHGYELVDGRLVEKPMGSRSDRIAFLLAKRLDDHCDASGLGHVFTAETPYACFGPDRRRVRKPDVSVVRSGRLPNEEPFEGNVPFPPDLAVEVVSPRDLAFGVDRKVEEYLAAGVRQVWIVNPDRRFVRVHRADGTVAMLQGEATLSGEDVVPGFECRVADLFRKPAGA